MKQQCKGYISIATAIALGGLLFVASSAADKKVLYKKIDKNGNVIFTDKPIDGAKQITVDTSTNVVDIPKAQKPAQNVSDDEEQQENTFKYSLLAIEQPTDDQAIRANDGSLYVVVALTPQLQPNHSVRLQMDGNPIGQLQKIPYFSLANIDRGTHQLSAEVIDDTTQKVIQTSATINFHLLRVSALQNQRRRGR